MKKLNSKSVVVGLVALLSILAWFGSGCDRRPGHEKAIRQRYSELIQALFREDYDTCVKLTDPAVVQAKGTQGTKALYKLVSGIAKLAQMTPEDVRIDGITFNEGLKTAQVQTSHRLKGEWKSQKPAQWVNVKGQWYLTP